MSTKIFKNNPVSNNVVVSDRSQTTSTLLPQKGIPPIGSIIAWVNGKFTAAGNSGFVSVLSIDTYISSLGYCLCDGRLLNDARSPVWNATSRRVPNLSDDRFLQGNSAISASMNGAPTSNFMKDHTHGHTSLTVNNDAGHVHSWGGGWNDSTATSGNTSWGALLSVESNYTNPDHGHAQYCSADNLAPNDSLYYTYDGDQTSHAYPIIDCATWDSDLPAHNQSYRLPSHRHWIKTRPTNSASSHTHTLSGSIGTGSAATATDNRPKYLSCLMIIRVF